MLGQEKPDFQRKQGGGKKFVTPSYQRNKEEQLSGVGMLVLSNNSPRNEVLAFNKQTLSRYNGRKRQYVDFNLSRESTSALTSKDRSSALQNN